MTIARTQTVLKPVFPFSIPTTLKAPVIINLVSESEGIDNEEFESEEYESGNENRSEDDTEEGGESAKPISKDAKKTWVVTNVAGHLSKTHTHKCSSKVADSEAKEEGCSVPIRKQTAKLKSLPLNKGISEGFTGSTTAFRNENDQYSEYNESSEESEEDDEGDESDEAKGTHFPPSKYTGNPLNLLIAKGMVPGPKRDKWLGLTLHQLEESAAFTSQNSKQTPHLTTYHGNVTQTGQRYIRGKKLVPENQKENGSFISSEISTLKMKGLSCGRSMTNPGFKRGRNGMPKILEDEEDSGTEEEENKEESTILPAHSYSIPPKNISPAKASKALENKQKLNAMPRTAEEQENKAQPKPFSNPSPLLPDSSVSKRRKTAAVKSQNKVNKDIDGALQAGYMYRPIPEKVINHSPPRETSKARSAKGFADLPGLVIRQIVDTLCEHDDGKLISSICFGLTCKLHWAFFKARWYPPGCDAIYESYLPKEDQSLLAPLLQNWVPESYRIMLGNGGKGGQSFTPMFLSKIQYGEGYTREEERLGKRYVACLSILDATNLDGMQLKSSRGLHAMIDNTIDLPSPHGMGHSWYDASASEYLFLVEEWKYSTLNGDGPGFKAICGSWNTFKNTCLWDWANGKDFNQFQEDWMDDEGIKGRQEIKQTLLKFDDKLKQFESNNLDLEDKLVAGTVDGMVTEDTIQFL
ncbi:hypothetical protein BOTCAL_0936g00030 [Botryotinia calthae]|uniref:Uncharacterized protein n=1 Tax=Botryotinia calthae TaxID=38488 RepID=A0A4Y8CF59_9HELO|nr:hypothetical protein BOTCAL_0936g00030 [Botryotinia calthae]